MCPRTPSPARTGRADAVCPSQRVSTDTESSPDWTSRRSLSQSAGVHGHRVPPGLDEPTQSVPVSGCPRTPSPARTGRADAVCPSQRVSTDTESSPDLTSRRRLSQSAGVHGHRVQPGLDEPTQSVPVSGCPRTPSPARTGRADAVCPSQRVSTDTESSLDLTSRRRLSQSAGVHGHRVQPGLDEPTPSVPVSGCPRTPSPARTGRADAVCPSQRVSTDTESSPDWTRRRSLSQSVGVHGHRVQPGGSGACGVGQHSLVLNKPAS
ncbi:hypothetical protein P7K49_027868 [Saguinus oedipus]|uniref:Uncharacterized protein n=1 Tax=Saguinus oedipus TaxID=9490 RepID=A0ABQ9UAS2_SAGOE|nr:hypothetical protein P7K49_027868 [Saguinus oedipus]